MFCIENLLFQYLYGEPSSVAGVRKSGPSSSTACDLYNVDDGSACMLLLCRGAIPIERASDFSSKLFSKINAKSVVALESLRLANYLTDRSADHEVLPPLLRVLQTSAAGGQAIAPPLEAPNVIEGAGAAVLTHVSRCPFFLRGLRITFLSSVSDPFHSRTSLPLSSRVPRRQQCYDARLAEGA